MKVVFNAKTLTALAAALFISIGPAQSALLIEANFDVDPNVEDAGWTHSGAWNSEASLAGGIASYDTIDTDANVSIIAHGQLTGQSAVARMRVLADDGFNGGGSSMNYILNDYFFTVGIVSDNVFHPASVNAISFGALHASSPLDTSQFHNIGLNITDLSTGKFDIYVDGVLVLANNQAPTCCTGCCNGQFQFGDNEGQADANTELDWIKVFDHQIPEPATLGLLGLGGLLLALRRRMS